ncbi:MAG: ABC transporter substrate-binding protein [Bacteroidetes bacterium]|nr:ABC transporter substrate-binding protein [Bacteroidota bacterium]
MTKHSLFRLHLFCLLALFNFSCVNHNQKVPEKTESHSIVLDPDYARGFRIIDDGQAYFLEIFDPSAGQHLLARFIFQDISETKEVASSTPAIHLPVNQIIALSATQWGMLLQLDAGHLIAGISEAPYVRDPRILEMLKRGEVAEVARDGLFRYELLSKYPGALMLYSPDASGLPEPIKALPLTPLPWTDFLEPHPLGRAEWIRLLGFLTGYKTLADSIFGQIKAEYERLSHLASETTSRPTIFADKPFAGQWYVPGGRSYMASIIRDAGGDYVFSHLDATGSIPLDPEAIFARAVDADFWRIAHAGDIGGYEGLLSENKVFEQFAAFRNRRVIFCNTMESRYFELGPLEPQLILADFIAIFHPEILPDHKPRYHYLLK